MRSPDVALITAKNKLDSDDPWLVLLQLTHEDWEIVNYDSLTDNFHEGETVTGGTSGASATVHFVVELTATTGYLVTGDITSGPFQDSEDLDGDHSVSPGSGSVTTPLPTGEAVFRYARNNESITYETVLWERFSFEFETLVDTTNQVPSLALAISNADRMMEGYVNKGAGFINDQVRILIVYAGDLTADPIIDELFQVKSAEITDEAIVFTLGLRNPLVDPFPSFVYSRKICRWKFKDSDCGYSGGETECDKTMTDCIARANESRFGAFPAIPGSAFDF